MTPTDRFSRAVDALVADHPATLSALGAAILVGAHEGLAHDTRSFARRFDVAHALVIRECVSLASEHRLLTLDDRQERSQRLFYALTDEAQEMVENVMMEEVVVEEVVVEEVVKGVSEALDEKPAGSRSKIDG